MVIDEPGNNESSRVAAGLYNPITGRKMVKTWQADVLFPLLKSVYRQIEKSTSKNFLYEKAIYRPFFDVAEQNEWQGRSAETAWQPYVQEVLSRPQQPEYLHNPYGGIMVGNSGWVDISTMLDAWSQQLHQGGEFKDEVFEEDKLEISDTKVQYKNIEAKAVVYANGRQAADSQYWNWLPFSPVKGEVLTIETEAHFKYIPNRGIFMAPAASGSQNFDSGKNYYRVGSTYHHNNLVLEPTERGKTELIEKLSALFCGEYKIVDHEAGIRPATKDRRPFVGQHPAHKTLYILNGLGTKGVSLAPYCATALLDNILYQSDIQAEINISRYFSLY